MNSPGLVGDAEAGKAGAVLGLGTEVVGAVDEPDTVMEDEIVAITINANSRQEAD
jgi:hypothetical protein